MFCMEKEKKITSIQISEDLWDELNKRKNLGETFEDVIQRMILEEPPIKKKGSKK